MTETLAVLAVAAIWVGSIAVLGGTVQLARRRYHERDRRNPLTKGLLRGPGHTLREQVEEIRLDVMTYLAICSSMPLFAVVVYVLNRHLTPSPSGPHALWYILIGIGALGFGAYKLVGLVKRARNLSLGLEAETAIGQELNLLMKDGFSVFHDVPGDKAFNIDHVVVGRRGVFAVETKGRAKPTRVESGEGHRVEHRDGKLFFPGWVEAAPLEQARRNADWLRKWLTGAVGVPVDAKPVLMLPGWYIETKSKPVVAVMNGTNCRKYFLNAGNAELSEQLVRQIEYQLDTRCRDVEPRSYRPLKDG